MIINTERFQLKSLTTENVTEQYLSWFSGSEEVEKYIDFAKKESDIDELVRYVRDRESRREMCCSWGFFPTLISILAM